MGKRTACHLDPPIVMGCLANLPPLAFKAKQFIPYENLNMKRAPSWGAMEPYVATLKAVLDASGGRQILQAAMMNGTVQFVKKEGLELSTELCERASYAIRCMISQMANHKQKERSVPRSWCKVFQSLMDRIILDLGDDDDDDNSTINDIEPDGEDKEMKIMAVRAAPDLDDVLSVASSWDQDTSALFCSSDPDLQALLEPEMAPATTPRRCRLTGKTTDPAVLPPASRKLGSFASEEIAALMDTGEALDPAAFKLLNAEKKKETAEKSDHANRAKRARLASKTGDTKNKTAAKSSFMKLEHSKTYHREFKYCTKNLGLSIDVAKQRARTAAKKRTEEIMTAQLAVK
jgi:hypothetical protein